MLEERIYSIYGHTSPSNKSYIGQTFRLHERDCEHARMNGSSPAFHNAIAKYGWDNFIHEILEENLTLEEANIREVYWIEFYGTLSPNGYNLNTGGNNFKFSDETRKRMSESRSGEKHPMFGKHHSEEAKQKIRDNHADQSGEQNGMFGKTLSDEAKRKISEIQTGQTGKLCRNSKKWIVTFPDGHEEFIMGLNDLCIEYNLAQANLSRLGKTKGFKCRLATEQEILDNP